VPSRISRSSRPAFGQNQTVSLRSKAPCSIAAWTCHGAGLLLGRKNGASLGGPNDRRVAVKQGPEIMAGLPRAISSFQDRGHIAELFISRDTGISARNRKWGV
jgi:hypothetical protein